jgi:hypothetical protein
MAKGFGGLPGGMGNMQGLLKQAQKMQEQIEKAQEEVERFEADAQSGGGMVRVKLNGKFELLSLGIAKEVVNPDDIEMLQDLVRAAINEAVMIIHAHKKEKMGKVAGGVNIPGF